MKKAAVALTFLLFFCCFVVSGAVLTFQSHPSSTNTATDMVFSDVGPVIPIPPNPAWYTPAGTTWVSPWQSGDPSAPGFYSPVNGTTVIFSHMFEIPLNFLVMSATLQVLADDTTSGWLNGNILFPPGSGSAPHCVANPPGCVLSTLWTGNVTTNLFHSGMNTLQLPTEQLNGQSFGANWVLEVNGEYRQPEVPEPGTVYLFAGGVLFLFGIRRWRFLRFFQD